MALTQRRKEFLLKIIKLYEATKYPVHYVTVAQNLGVSKWTAYDMLRELVTTGYLTMSYTVNRLERSPGRSMVLFLPTTKALNLFQTQPKETSVSEEWLVLKERLLSILEKNLEKKGATKIIDDLLAEMPQIDASVPFSAYTITLLTAYLQNIEHQSLKRIKNLLPLSEEPALTLSLFAGTAVGAMVKNMKETLNQKITGIISKFQKNIAEFNLSEKKELVIFLGEALQKAIP
jgi:hypothetical protein